jgi:hypothetical protein
MDHIHHQRDKNVDARSILLHSVENLIYAQDTDLEEGEKIIRMFKDKGEAVLVFLVAQIAEEGIKIELDITEIVQWGPAQTTPPKILNQVCGRLADSNPKATRQESGDRNTVIIENVAMAIDFHEFSSQTVTTEMKL